MDANSARSSKVQLVNGIMSSATLLRTPTLPILPRKLVHGRPHKQPLPQTLSLKLSVLRLNLISLGDRGTPSPSQN